MPPASAPLSVDAEAAAGRSSGSTALPVKPAVILSPDTDHQTIAAKERPAANIIGIFRSLGLFLSP